MALDAKTSLFELENEIQETVQQLKDDLEENQTLYDIDTTTMDALDRFDEDTHESPPFSGHSGDIKLGAEVPINIAIDDALEAMNNEILQSPVSAVSSNHTNFFTPHSVSGHHVDRSDKRAMLKAFLLSQSEDKETANNNPIQSINAHSKPEQFQQLLDGLNDDEEMQHHPAVSEDTDPTLHLNASSSSHPETQQELSELYREIEKTQKEFQDQLLSVDKGLIAERLLSGINDRTSTTNTTEETEENENDKDRTVHFDDDASLKQKLNSNRQSLRTSISVQMTPKRRLSDAMNSPVVARSCTMGSPKQSTNTHHGIWDRAPFSPQTQRSRSSTFHFGTGRELEWEKGLKQRLNETDPLQVCLDRIGSPRKLQQLRLMVDRAQHPSECTFHPKLNQPLLPSMYPQLSNLNQPFLDRQQQWVHAANKKLQYEQTKLRLKQESECTFTPQINERDDTVSSFKAQDQYQQTRISNQHESIRKRRLMLQIQEKQEEDFKRHCTFKPKLCKSSAKMVKDLKKNRQFKPRCKSMTQLKIHDDDDEMRECTFQPQTNQSVNIKLNHVAEYLHSDPFQRLSSTSTLKLEKNNGVENTGHSTPSPSNHGNGGSKDFIDRMEMDLEIRKHRQRIRKKKADPVFQPNINRKSQRMVNKIGLNFEDRQNQSLKNRSIILQQHETKVVEGNIGKEECKDLRFRPKLNRKSISLVENKKVPRNAAGYSRANYYIYSKAGRERNDENALSATKNHNDKIVQNNPKLQKYLSMDVMERLLDQKTQKEVFHARKEKEKEKGSSSSSDRDQLERRRKEEKMMVSNAKKMSEIELEDFIERQKNHEKVRKKRIEKLWKRFNNEQSDDDAETDFAVSSIIRDHQDILEDDSEQRDDHEIGLSYTQLFQSKLPKSPSKAQQLSYSVLSQRQLQADSQFVAV